MKTISELQNNKKKLTGIPKGLSVIYNSYIPSDWQQDILLNQASVEYGISSPLNRALSSGTRILAMPNVNVEGDFVLDDIPFIESEKVKPKNILKEGDLLFNWRNGSEKHVGKTAIYNLKGIHTHVGFLLRIRTKGNINSFFLYSYLNFIREKGYFTKSKVQVNNSFNKEELLELPLIYPPINEQNKISKILNTWDIAIKNSQKHIEILQKRKIGLLQQLLSGKKKLNGFSGILKLYSLNEIAIFKNGKGHEKNIDEGGSFVVVNSKFISSESQVVKYSNKAFSPLKKGEITLVMSDIPNGRALAKCFLIDADNKYTLNQRICSISVKTGFDNTFVYYLLNRNPYFLRFNDGVKQTNLRKDDVLDCPLMIPPIKEQQAIANVLTTADKEITTQKNYLNQLKSQKKELMKQLLTGQKRVNVNN